MVGLQSNLVLIATTVFFVLNVPSGHSAQCKNFEYLSANKATIASNTGSDTHYERRKYCRWLLENPKQVKLAFQKFSVKGGSDCSQASVSVLDGNSTVKGRYCNAKRPPNVIISTKGSLTVEFRSSGTANPSTGFTATLEKIIENNGNGKESGNMKCEELKEPQRHRIINIAVFYSKAMLDYWKQQKRRFRYGGTMNDAIQTLVNETNKWFTEKMVKNGNSVRIVVESKNIRRMPENSVKAMYRAVKYSLYDVVEKLCPIANNYKKPGDTWNVAFFFDYKTDSQVQHKLKTRGVVKQLGSVCSKSNNCGILLKSTNNPSTFNIFPNVWVHEIGHMLNLVHLGMCEDETAKKNCLDPYGKYDVMMISPGGAKGWSTFSKRRMNAYFGNKRKFTCMKWQCQA